ncbi:MAG TPA: hypothetical protein DD420_25655 [Streptomyces sp.]|nr:hypothetical protein [Streptomyces sp.]
MFATEATEILPVIHVVYMAEYDRLIRRAPARAATLPLRGVRLAHTMDTGTLRAEGDTDPAAGAAEPRKEDRRKIKL